MTWFEVYAVLAPLQIVLAALLSSGSRAGLKRARIAAAQRKTQGVANAGVGAPGCTYMIRVW